MCVTLCYSLRKLEANNMTEKQKQKQESDWVQTARQMNSAHFTLLAP